MYFLDVLSNLFFPNRCGLCNELYNATICKNCLPKLTKRTQNCLYCKRNNPTGSTCFKCTNTQTVNTFYSPYKYHTGLKKLIAKGKLKKISSIFSDLGDLLEFTPATRIDFVTSIPSSEKSLKKTGFNHAELIAKAFAYNHKIEYKNTLTKNPSAKEQKKLEYNERKKIKNLFACNSDLRGKNIIIIDDIITTGSTIKSAAKTLRKQGANLIIAISACSDR